MLALTFAPADLAPGDGKAATLPLAGWELRRVASAEDPLFETVYQALWAQFGAAQELECRAVLARRLAWPAGMGADGLAMRYDMLTLFRQGELVAVRDHTATADAEAAVVHLSHVWICPSARRTGLAGWLRALPLQTARACLAGARLPADTPTTLVAEMEYPDGLDESRNIRLQAYEKAGFRKIQPQPLDYVQPDFRPPAEIDAGGGPVPLPFQLIVRRVGREAETTLPGAEVVQIIERLYALYGREFRPQDMAMVYRHLTAKAPAAAASVPLLPPTAV